jgi:hypothetical protein
MNPWLILGFVVAIAVSGGVGMYQGKGLGKAEVQQKWDQERAAQEAEYAAAQAAAREKEQTLQANADSLRKEKDREIRDLNARAVALTNSLRDRPSRTTTESSPVPGAASTGPAPVVCTGKELPREDAEFLVREAGRADELRASLKQCYAQYEALKPN